MQRNILYFAVFFTLLITGCITKPEDSGLDLNSMTGRVIEPNDLPVSNALVTLMPGNYSAVTDENGYFAIDKLSPGNYTVLVQKNTLQHSFRQKVTVRVFENQVLNVSIPVTGFVFVDASDSLKHNFMISRYELTLREAAPEDITFKTGFPKDYPYNAFDSRRAFLYDWWFMEPGYFFDYLNKRSIEDGLTPCYNGLVCNFDADGYRLPTVDEWMYAARGGKYSKGYTYAGSNDLNEISWYNGNSGDLTHLVGQKKPNELGIYDMNGNIAEICYLKVSKSGYDELEMNKYIVCCGGSYKSPGSAIGFKWTPLTDVNGYRIVRTVK